MNDFNNCDLLRFPYYYPEKGFVLYQQGNCNPQNEAAPEIFKRKLRDSEIHLSLVQTLSGLQKCK